MTRVDIEPWVAAYRHSLKATRTPLVWLLVSQRDARKLAAGTVPPRVQREVEHLLSWKPRAKP
jgi:hypothetical protein